jgi:DNA polymerase III delta prime subunit
MSYDFSQLNDKEFEALSADLLSVVHGVQVERFKPGRDQGVDGRFFTPENTEVIVQCKHYLKSGYPSLFRKLKTEEVDKVKRLKPAKYVLITSLQLSRVNKKEIRKIFSPYIVRDDDVYGQDDLNSILSDNPKIEEKFFKLWISSTPVLQRILHNAIKGRSEFEIERIQRESRLYVQTENHSKARDSLRTNGVLIISGEPGIGKTTLARNLCLSYVSEGFEFLDIEESLSEAEGVYQKGKRQIFLFDDFLGSNYFEAVQNKKDSHIVNFMDRVRNDKTKRFILTSRTNILNAGVLYSPIFANRNLRSSEYMLTIGSLEEFDRALILYNHIWFSSLPESFIDEIYAGKRYRQIIRHDNFNPRLIDFILDANRVPVEEPTSYWRYISKTLQNPRDIWGDCFKVQNNEYVRTLVRLVVYNGGQISEPELRSSFNRYLDNADIKSGSHVEHDFSTVARLATRSFLNRSIADQGANYTLFNPSIADFVLSEYRADDRVVPAIFQALGTVKSLEQLAALGKQSDVRED